MVSFNKIYLKTNLKYAQDFFALYFHLKISSEVFKLLRNSSNLLQFISPLHFKAKFIKPLGPVYEVLNIPALSSQSLKITLKLVKDFFFAFHHQL